jgi:hypothetical protein
MDVVEAARINAKGADDRNRLIFISTPVYP